MVPDSRPDERGGFAVLDGLALVMGAAVASVHVKVAANDADGAMSLPWISILFCWILVTSTGPFLYLARRFGTRPPGYPRLGDRLWAVLGLPWCLSALVRASEGDGDAIPGRHDPAYLGSLGIGLTLATTIIVTSLAARFLLNPPACDLETEPKPWTQRIGMILAVAWPIQVGVGLVMLD